ncbi:hypothetical protein E0D81_08440 [Lelliottia amnigena]|nr:hypothetical protein E0D81_08440 [Lelliottia amnigena]
MIYKLYVNSYFSKIPVHLIIFTCLITVTHMACTWKNFSSLSKSMTINVIKNEISGHSSSDVLQVKWRQSGGSGWQYPVIVTSHHQSNLLIIL